MQLGKLNVFLSPQCLGCKTEPNAFYKHQGVTREKQNREDLKSVRRATPADYIALALAKITPLRLTLVRRGLESLAHRERVGRGSLSGERANEFV